MCRERLFSTIRYGSSEGSQIVTCVSSAFSFITTILYFREKINKQTNKYFMRESVLSFHKAEGPVECLHQPYQLKYCTIGVFSCFYAMMCATEWKVQLGKISKIVHTQILHSQATHHDLEYISCTKLHSAVCLYRQTCFKQTPLCLSM